MCIRDSLSKRQHRFIRGRSIIGAVEEVVKTIQAAQQSIHYSRRMLATLDVKKAFTSARWCNILYALEHTFRILQYIMRVVTSFKLQGHRANLQHSIGRSVRKITSCLRVLIWNLWNIFYYGNFHLDIHEHTFLAFYTDDIVR